jgi:multiple sugar transport system ATP-binding protein
VTSITLEKLTKVYANGFEAIHELDLEIAHGEFMVMVGPSGCGKTTALRMVAGLEDITSGLVRIGDRIVNDIPAKQRDIAMIFQNYALYPNMTVAKNIGFALKVRKVPKQEIQQKVSDAATILGLTEWLDRKPAQLSGGQRQRVAMGRAILREPSVFLMDEPLSNLDAMLRVRMRAEVMQIQRRLGVATLYVTHDQVEAMTMGDRVAVLRAGILQQCDTPQVLYAAPVNLFVAAFIGSPAMNLLAATVAEGANAVLVGSQRIELGPAVLAARPALQRYANHEIVLGIRPEDLAVNVADRSTEVLQGDVVLIEALGSDQLVHFSTDARRIEAEGTFAEANSLTEGTLIPRGEVVARVDPRATLVPGRRGQFALEPLRLQFFDRSTGEAITT